MEQPIQTKSVGGMMSTIMMKSCMKVEISQGDCSLATALAAGRMLLSSAPLYTSCVVSVVADNGIFSVMLTSQPDGRISETYEAVADKQIISL